MKALTDLRGAIEAAEESLEEEALRPDRSADWLAKKNEVETLASLVESEMVPAFRLAREAPELEEVREALAARVAGLVAEVAALAHLIGAMKRYRGLLEMALEASPDEDQIDELEAAKSEPEAFVALQDGRWLHRRARYGEAKRVLRAGLEQASAEALKRALALAIQAPRPLREAPPLFTFNGFGTAIFGGRDEHDDGSQVGTLCVTALFIPLFPLRAYRLWREGDDFHFIGSVPLSAFARAMQAVAVVGVIALVGGIALAGYLDSPARAASLVTEEGAALEASGDRDAALEKYWKAIDEYGMETDVSEAAMGVVRLGLASMPTPCTAAAVEPAQLAGNAFHQLPADLRSGSVATTFIEGLERCAGEIEVASLEGARAKLEVLEVGLDAGASKPSLEAARRSVMVSLAELLGPSRPAEALRYWVELLPGEPARAEARSIILDFGNAHALHVENEPLIRRFLEDGADAAISEALTRAEARASASAALVDEADEAKLRAALGENPSDHAVAMALASIERGAGRTEEAIRVIRATGAVGRMPSYLQLLLASAHRERGDFADADSILTALIADLTPRYRRAQRAYSSAADALRTRVIREIDEGKVPPDLELRARGVSSDEQPRIFQEWLEEQLEADPEVSRRLEALREHDLVVPASIGLGTVKLERAQASVGPEREALLAEAEGVFLSIGTVAAGHPSYHLGLGQLYHRMGRIADGEAELERVLAMDVPGLSFEAAHIYRELGLLERSRSILEKVHGSGADEAVRKQAAFSLSVMAPDLDTKARWLAASDQSAPRVRAGLDEVRGSKAARDGKWDEAEAAYAAVTAHWEKSAKNDAAAANNAAVSYQARYSVTGKLQHLEKALEHFESSVKLDPQSVVASENLSEALHELGAIRALAPWVDPSAALDGDDAGAIIASLLAGSERDALVTALRAEPHLRRAHELRSQLMVLAPHRPSPHLGAMRRLDWLDDEDGLGRLLTKLDAGSPMKPADMAQRRAYERGERDDELRRHLESARVKAAQRLERIGPRAKASTRAVAHERLGDAWLGLALVFDDAQALEAALSELERAVTLWPESGIERDRAFALLVAAVMGAREQAPSLAAAWKEHSRTRSVVALADEVLAAPGGAEALAALRAQPALAQAVASIEPAISRRPELWHYSLARWSGDDELIASARAPRARATIRLPLEIATRLYPGEPREASELALYQRNQSH